MRHLPFYILMITSVHACSPAYGPHDSSSKNTEISFEEYHLLMVDLDGDGTYETERDYNEAKLVDRSKHWYADLNYPAEDREKGISGIVVLTAYVNQEGRVEKVDILKSVSPNIDKEAKRAFLDKAKLGYVPLEVNGQHVNFKLDIPAGFYLW